MTGETVPPIPEQIANVMLDDEIENMRAFDGWAHGSVIETEGGDIVAEYEDCWIELFDGGGRAGVFDGVRFMTVSGDGYTEAYAYEDEDAYDASATNTAYYVSEYTHE